MGFFDDDPNAQLAQQLAALGQRRDPNANLNQDPAAKLLAYGQQRQQQQQDDYSDDPMAGPMAWSDVAKQAARNVIPSAVQFGKDIVQPVLHPIDTATNLYNVGAGLMEKAGISSGDMHVKYADAVGQYFADKYGGVENVKRAIATDPVGVMGDLSAFFSVGGGALARAPGILGRAGEIAGTAGRIVDPLTNAGRLGGAAASAAGWAAREGLGLTTGAGPEAFRAAEQAGREGGQAAQTFRENITGAAPQEEAVIQARQATARLQQLASRDYRQEMARIGQNPTILSFNDVDRALIDMDRVATFRGQSRMAPGLRDATEEMRDAIHTQVEWWKNRRASQHWTAEGFDALKQSIGDLRDQTAFGTPERRVADEVYHAIRDTIIAQDPTYARVMRGYEQAKNIIREINGTLSTNPNARIDTSLRKLQSVLRNNVSSNYGYRSQLLQVLQNAGAPHLMQRLAGQMLNTWTPRGIGRAVFSGAPAAIGGFLAGGFTPAALGAVPGLVASSPRLMGEAAYGLGAARRYAGQAGRYLPLRQLAEPLRQVGRQDPRQQAIRIRSLNE